MRKLAGSLMVAGSALVLVGVARFQAVSRSGVPFQDLIDVRWLTLLWCLTMIASLGLGLPNAVVGSGRAIALALAATTSAALVFSLLSVTFGPWLLPRLVVLGLPIYLTPVLAASAALSSFGRVRQTRADRIVLIAGTEKAARLQEQLNRATLRGCEVVTVRDPRNRDEPWVPLDRLVEATGGTVVVMAEEFQDLTWLMEEASVVHRNGLRVRTLRLFYEQWLGKLPVSELSAMHLLFDVGEIHGAAYRRTKRAAEALIALVGVFVVGITIPIIVIANAFGNRGPLFFSQDRVGLNGTNFRILKFRSMTPTTSSAGAWTQDNDPRITPFGSFLRRTHIDELPQFWNLMRGELSLIGPRPEQPHYVEKLQMLEPVYGFRHSVRPGLTGWAQINYPYGNTERDAFEKLEYDLYYLRHQGPMIDLRIATATASHLVFRKGN